MRFSTSVVIAVLAAGALAAPFEAQERAVFTRAPPSSRVKSGSSTTTTNNNHDEKPTTWADALGHAVSAGTTIAGGVINLQAQQAALAQQQAMLAAIKAQAQNGAPAPARRRLEARGKNTRTRPSSGTSTTPTPNKWDAIGAITETVGGAVNSGLQIAASAQQLAAQRAMLQAAQAQAQALQQQQQQQQAPASRRSFISDELAQELAARVAAHRIREILDARDYYEYDARDYYEYDARDDYESGALAFPKFKSSTIKNVAETLNHLTTAGTSIANTAIQAQLQAQQAQLMNAVPQRRDDESGALSFKLPKFKLPPIHSESIKNIADGLNSAVSIGTNIADTVIQAQQAQQQAQALAPQQRRDDDESGAIKFPKFSSSTIANGAGALGHLINAGTSIAGTVIQAQQAQAQAQQAQLQAQMLANAAAPPQRRDDDDESGAIKFKSSTIANGAHALGSLVSAGTSIANTAIQAQQAQLLAQQQAALAQAQAAAAAPQRRDDDESGALAFPKISSSTIKNGAEAFKHVVTAGTSIADTVIQAQQAQLLAQQQAALAHAQAQAAAAPQRRDDEESGALKFPKISSSTIKNGAEAFGHLVTAGTSIANTAIQAQQAQLLAQQQAALAQAQAAAAQ